MCYYRSMASSDPDRHRENSRNGMRAARLRNQQHVWLVKSVPCMDCGNSFPPVAMDFDHRPGDGKFKDISLLVNGAYSIARIDAEIAKCDIVCSNCHRIRTHERGQYSSVA